MDKKKNRSQVIEYGFITILSVLSYLILMWILTGRGVFSHNTYNSYALQAEAWTHGHLDLGQDYSYLELALFKGKYYVSFPPFPSYILFPLAFIFGSNTPDALLMWLEDIIAALYLYKLANKFTRDPKISALTTIFAMLGTNVTFNMLNPWVWFSAQTICFMLSVMAIYYAFEGKGGLSLFLWACSVGCRPMQAVFVPVLLYILYKHEAALLEKERAADKMTEEVIDLDCEGQDEIVAKTNDATGDEAEISDLQSNRRLTDLVTVIKKRWKWVIPAGLIALSYMILNYLRFGSITEFGHNYLPEFVEAEHGQFDTFYFGNNLKMLFNLPEFDDEGRMIIDHFGNLNFMIASPFVVFALILFILIIVRKKKDIALADMAIILLCAAYMCITMMHKTMGGWHFGNRYSNDIIPWLYLSVVLGLSKIPGAGKYQTPLLIFGICLNAVGTVVVYNGMYIV